MMASFEVLPVAEVLTIELVGRIALLVVTASAASGGTITRAPTANAARVCLKFIV